ncbi:hypothetical protein OIU74_028007 [Salix koriyanagi]|uniref:Uncharacterized protein n=1 Tax=Salix koriyanagi TaxID=2511006 RepID=A0A9Q0VAZ9_9ROSI|nr:hypothetical protein OIU74_028007 [Salix koriyanagi]
MKRPFPPLKGLDMDEVTSIISTGQTIRSPQWHRQHAYVKKQLYQALGSLRGTSATGPSATGPPAGASVGVDGPSLDGAGALEGDLAGDLAGVLAVGGAAGGVLVLGAGAGVFLGTAAVPGGGGGAMFSIPGVSIGSLTCSTEML